MRRYICLIITAIAAIVSVAGCGSTGHSKSATTTSGSTKPYAELTWGMPSFTGAIDWTKNEWFPVTSIEHLAVQNLVEFEPNGHIKDGLARSVERPAPTTYVYKLRTGVKFSDGNPLSASDVVYSLGRNLYGKESILKPYWEDVASISSRGASTVVIQLKRPYAAWPDVMAFTSQIIEKTAAEKAGEHELGMPAHPVVGTGPWKIDSYRPEVGVRLSRNSYWSGPIQLAQKIDVELFKEEEPMSLALRSGAIDGSFFYMKPKVFANVPGTRSITTQGVNVAYISSKVTAPPFNNVHVRRAIAYATDVKGMIKALFPGDAATVPGIVPASLFADLGSSAEVNAVLGKLRKYTFDLAAAKRELAKSPYPHGFTTTMQAEVAEQPMVLLLQILAADLSKIGIHAKIEELPSDEILSRIEKKQFTIIATEDAATYADPEGLLGFILRPGEFNNTALYANPEVVKLLNEQQEELNPSARLRLIGRLLAITEEEVPYIAAFSRRFFGTLSEKFVYPSFSQWSALFGSWALGVKQAS